MIYLSEGEQITVDDLVEGGVRGQSANDCRRGAGGVRGRR